jgi:endonuclease/exonuclease/phosphatase family metal-dependent hydrolase
MLRPRHRSTLALTLSAFMLAAGCAGTHLVGPRETPAADGLSWFEPIRPSDRHALGRWRGAVGPAYVASHTRAAPRAGAPLTVVSWNTAVGSADVPAYVAELRAERGDDTPLVLLLQEVYRTGSDVPRVIPPGSSFAAHLGTHPVGRGADIATIAKACGLDVYYAPSMRNGGPLVSDEDRGNAILSNLPLSDLTAIELPFERQRRVALAATVSGGSPGGAPWRLRVVSAHLDNVVGLRKWWLAGSAAARARQARALVGYLQNAGPTVLAGDFNTWFGFQDPAYREIARAFQTPVPADRRRTFRGLLRLDHMFLRLPDGWTGAFARARSRYGSDHYPLVATIELR